MAQAKRALAKGAPKRAPSSGTTNASAKRGAQGRTTETRPWGLWVVAIIATVAALRLGFNALGLVPVHFDEAQYWAYGQELAWGHFSKPPLVGWVIGVTTALGSDTTFWLRVGVVLAHAAVAAMLYLIGRYLWDGRTGFWAAVAYTMAPGVTVSAVVMTTDPVLMAFWALALYAWFRAAESGSRASWAGLGAALGLSILAKYTGLAFATGALGYGLFSARGRDWTGTAIAGVVALVVVSPNLAWLAANGFVTVRHVAEDAAPGGENWNLGELGEFLGAQLGVIGPVWFVAILAGWWWRRRWVDDWRMRMLAWQTFALLGAITVLAFYSRAQPNWAAPAYVAGSLLAARVVLAHGWSWALKAQAAIGAMAAMALYAAAAGYAAAPLELPRGPDPFKKMRIAEPFCERALGVMAEEGAEILLSDDRRRLSECMFLGGLTWDDIAVWNPELIPHNHAELVSTLRPGDQRAMLLAVMSPAVGRTISRHFDEAREIETGEIRTHTDRAFGYSLWVVQGFREY